MTEIPGTSVSFKKEDKITMGLVVAAIGVAVAGGLYGLYLALPYLIEIAENTIVLLAELAVAGFLLIFLAQMFLARNAIYYKLKLFARNLRKAVVKSDPIGTIDIGIRRFEARLEDVSDQQVAAEAATNTLAQKIRNNKRTGVLDYAENEERLAVVAQQQSLPTARINTHLVAAERWRRAGETLQPMLDGQRRRQAKLGEARVLAETGLQNLRNQKAVLEVQLDAYRAEAAQAKAFKRFFGTNEDLDMIEMAVEEVERQSAQCEAEVVEMLRMAEPMIQRDQLQQAADAENARARLAAAKEPARVEPPKSAITIERK